MKYKIAPSLMGMDLLNVQKQIECLNDKAFQYHIDILDWHFAKNLCFSPEFIRQVKTITNVPLEVHIMVENMQLDIIEEVVKAGANTVTLHAREINRNVFKYIDYLKSNDCKLGIVLDPAVPLSEMQCYIEHVDLINFMAVTPGFAGQKLVPSVLDKIRESLRLKEEKGYSYLTQVDGGFHPATYKQVIETNVEIFIVGATGLFGVDKDLNVAWNKLEKALDDSMSVYTSPL